MAEQKRKGGVKRAAIFVLLLAAALVLFRFLGPGGRPAEDPRPPEPSPSAPPSAAQDPSPPAAESKDARIGGRILAADGRAVEGAEIEGTLEVPGEESPRGLRAAPTGPDGRFDLGPLPGKRGRLRLRAFRGPLSVEAEADLSGSAGPVSLDLRLPPSFTVGGIVVSAEEGRPLPGIAVRWGEIETRTDALGRFVIRDVTAAVLADTLPDLELTGAGRKPLRRPLPRDRGLDDLLIRLDRQ